MPTKSTAAKTKAAKTVKKTTAKKSAAKKAPKTTAKKATVKVVAEKAPKITAEMAALASRTELARKSAEENYTQVNLTARSLKDSAIAAKNYQKPERKPAKKAAAKAPAKKAKKIVYNGLPTVRGKDYAKVVAEKMASAAMESRQALATKKSFAQAAAPVEVVEEKPVKKARKACKPKKETAKTTKTTKVAKPKTTKKKAVKKVEPAMASRIALAQKSAGENTAQNNLEARSKADGAVAAKGYKKPTRKKAAKAKNPAKVEMEAIINEMNAGARIMKMIEEVPGVPFEEAIQAVKDQAAMASRIALASKKVVSNMDQTTQFTQDSAKFYNDLDDYTMIEMFNALGVDMTLDTLKDQLSATLDIETQIKTYLDQVSEEGKAYTFEKDGFDLSVIPFLCNRVAETLPNKAQDNVMLAKKITADVDRMLINDGLNDSAIYNDLMDDVRKVLVFAQRNGVSTLAECEKTVPADLQVLVDRFMTVAYTILPGWQYNDVKYYEGFIYAVVAQFDDLVGQQNRVLMDIADLYIKHGDYQRGNDDYGYVLRENQIKDQIYYRYASVYEPFDPQRAKNIAQDALRVIDSRYEYHQKIVDILNK